jgi:cytochrome c oxidase subunit 4
MSEPIIADPEHDEHHVVGPLTYTFVWLSLLALTLLTVGAAYIEMGVLNPIVAVGIACIKGAIVVLLFMHLKYGSRLIKFTCAAGFFTFCILITMCLSDYLTRAWGQW